MIEVCFVNDSLATVSGHGSRDLVIEIRGRAVVWSPSMRGWCVQPKIARDLVALAESRGWRVVVTEGESTGVAR